MMKLTPHERRAFEALEARLREDDPAFATILEGGARPHWVRALTPLTRPGTFHTVLLLLIMSAPAALTLLTPPWSIAAGLAGYLLAVPLVAARAAVRPFEFRRTKRVMALLSEDNRPT